MLGSGARLYIETFTDLRPFASAHVEMSYSSLRKRLIVIRQEFRVALLLVVGQFILSLYSDFSPKLISRHFDILDDRSVNAHTFSIGVGGSIWL